MLERLIWAFGSGEGATTPCIIELKQLVWFDFDARDILRVM